jgi:DNA-binding transcriptional MerR regulator
MRDRTVPPAAGWLTTTEVCRRVGITYRQLDHWANRRYVTPSLQGRGKGNTRWWSPTDIARVRELVERIKDCPFHEGSQT